MQCWRPLALFLMLAVAAPGLCQTAPGRLADFRDETGHYGQEKAAVQRAVEAYSRPVTVYVSDNLPSDTDRFAHDHFREWKLPADGLLICIWPTARKVAMTVGPDLTKQGVNGTFLSGTVIPNHFKPGWKQGGLHEAVAASLRAIAAGPQSVTPPETATGQSDASGGSPPFEAHPSSSIPWALALLCPLAFVVVVIIAAVGGRRGPGPRSGRWGGSPWWYGPNYNHLGGNAGTTNTSSNDTSSAGGTDFGGSAGGDSGGGFSDTGSGSF